MVINNIPYVLPNNPYGEANLYNTADLITYYEEEALRFASEARTIFERGVSVNH